MLLPFEFAILDISEAKLLRDYIDRTTKGKDQSTNYAKIQKAGLLDIFNKLTEFIELKEGYEQNLRYFDRDEYT